MTTVGTHIKTASDAKGIFVLPDPPRFPDDMTSFDYLAATGNAHHLIEYLGNRDTTIVAGDRYVVLRPTRSMVGSHYPDMLVAFDVDPSLYKASNGYIISDHGKPPDFVLEIASPRTGRNDAGRKRVDYAKIGVPEYWRFDETGDYHGTMAFCDGTTLRQVSISQVSTANASVPLKRIYVQARRISVRPRRNCVQTPRIRAQTPRMPGFVISKQKFGVCEE